MPYVGGYFPGLVVKGVSSALQVLDDGHVRKRREANAEIKDANGNLVTLAEAQSNEDLNNKKTIRKNIVNSADISKGSDSIDVGRISHAEHVQSLKFAYHVWQPRRLKVLLVHLLVSI